MAFKRWNPNAARQPMMNTPMGQMAVNDRMAPQMNQMMGQMRQNPPQTRQPMGQAQQRQPGLVGMYQQFRGRR